ncbi:UNVERIFIED_CONTAM: hypothetical protein RMT77_010498 [Armadillidium vulgare]
MENYENLGAIGEGSFGRVFKARCRRSGETVALKCIPKRNKVDRELKSLRRECEIQKELFHPNIVRMIDAFETEAEVVAVSEYVPIQLYSLLEKHGTLPEERVRDIACNLISAIYYLHSLRILHRDIKPQNILLTLKGEAKLCDFGFSRKMGINTYVLTSVKGTPLYMAPELIDENPYDHTADLWSLGCILFELLTGKPPFCTTSIVQLIKMVQHEHVKWPVNFGEICKNFLEGLLQKEPSKRLTWPYLLDHPWIKGGVTVIQSSVDPSPLTCPLSSSQQAIKEQQKRQLIKQGLSQPKILRNFSENAYGNMTPANDQQCVADICNNVEPVSHNQPGFCDEKIFKENIEMLNPQNMMELQTFNETVKNNEQNNVPINADVRQGFGSSVRKLSTISQETGFKDDDVADITSRVPSFVSEDRKDSMVNYLSNSIDSSRRGSRPSFPTTDNIAVSHLSNINEESIANFSSAYDDKNLLLTTECSDKPIEKEEWLRFLDKNLSEVLNDSNTDIYYQHSEINMIISPLQNCNCPSEITEKINVMLMLPFVLEPIKFDKDKVLKVYLDCKVVPNLIYALKFVSNGKKNDTKSAEYNSNEIGVLHSLISLICFLLHSSNEFIVQFCDAVCILSTCTCLGQLMVCNSDEILEKLLSILNCILSHLPENSSVVEQILLNIPGNLCSTLEKLVNHQSAKICAAACILIGHSAKVSCQYMSSLQENHSIISDLINFETCPNIEIQKAASFAVSFVLKFLETDKE